MNKIFIYDLTSATRWHVLEGHKSNVIAIAFSDNGKSLASYSPDDGEVKLWKMGSTIFGILGGNPHCWKTIPVSKLDSKCMCYFVHERNYHIWIISLWIFIFRTIDGTNDSRFASAIAMVTKAVLVNAYLGKRSALENWTVDHLTVTNKID